MNWGDQEDYEVIRKIGRGKYSEVFERSGCLSINSIMLVIPSKTATSTFLQCLGYNKCPSLLCDHSGVRRHERYEQHALCGEDSEAGTNSTLRRFVQWDAYF